MRFPACLMKLNYLYVIVKSLLHLFVINPKLYLYFLLLVEIRILHAHKNLDRREAVYQTRPRSGSEFAFGMTAPG